MCEAIRVSSIQVADQTFVAAAPERVAAAIGSTSRWRMWWPDLRLTVGEDRGEKGIRWTVSGPVVGTMEVWLEAVLDGVIVHYFLHAEPTDPAQMRDLASQNRTRRVQGKAMSFEVKKELETGRAPGEPPH
ncbi:MAG: polyketide cyclase / dehydrase and lipid transport [Rhodococcus sp.]|nr:polyketide cyclase / dehydrase and lipid transport [Rhodococcus sp. (in: high G+C Gram-positive bacteria)]